MPSVANSDMRFARLLRLFHTVATSHICQPLSEIPQKIEGEKMLTETLLRSAQIQPYGWTSYVCSPLSEINQSAVNFWGGGEIWD